MVSLDFEFRKLVLDKHIGSDVIKYCYQCNRCTDSCPVAEASSEFYTNPFDPRLMVLGGLLGFKDVVESLLSKASIVPWGCTVCDTCDTVCPQGIEVTEIITLLKNVTVAKGIGADSVVAQAKAVFDSGKAIPSQPSIERRREQLGLPAVSAPDLNEVQTLLKNIGADKKLG
jgi:heterodisulfide reductase subunit C